MRDARLIRALLIASFLAPGGLLADSAWTIPGIVNAAGLNGTHFVSDLTVTNPGGGPANITLSFFPGSSNPKNLTLNPGQTIVYSDVAGVAFGVSGGAGALSISSDQPLLIRAKTYNTAASGTYGVALPVVSSDRLLASGDVGDSLWISQDASGSSGYRTNIAVVFPDASGGAATVTVYDADGNERGHQDYSLDTPGLQQFSVGSFAGAVSIARARIAVTSGHAAGYAVVVDNITGDSSLFAFEDLPAGIQDVLVNGVARATGRNGAFFRTDGRVYNPTNADATITVSFHASGNANPSPATASFVVPAGKIRDVVDVLDSLLSLPVGSAGALRFRSDWPVAILCRTSNVDPSGVRPGTFGSQQKPVPLLSFVNSADAGAAVTGIRQDSAFRTNVGFAAGADGAQYTLTLANADGATVATTSVSLGAFGWTQPGVQDLFPTTTIPDNATLNVKVTAGSVDVFDSSIDNLSGDPVVTPIASLPVAIPSSATIGPAGGSIRSDDGRLTLRVPAGALGSNVNLSLTTNTSNGAPQGTGASYTLSPGGQSFVKPATLVFHYRSSDTDGSDAGALGLAFRSGNSWYVATGGSVNSTAQTLTVPIASTAPAAAAKSAPLHALEGTPEEWAPFQSLQIFPKKTALPTKGKMNLVVVDVGSSSSIGILGSSPLSPIDPSLLIYTWYLNGEPELTANAAYGKLASHDGNNAQYTAPACPPDKAWNPVAVAVSIVKAGDEIPKWKSPFSRQCTVRIVPRDWSFTVTEEQNYVCTPVKGGTVGFAVDHVTYKFIVVFSLDDNLNVDLGTLEMLPETAKFAGDPSSCDKTYINLTRIQSDGLSVDVVGGAYNMALDPRAAIDLTLGFNIPTSLGYNYINIGSDGKLHLPGKNTPGPLVHVPPMLLTFPEGTFSANNSNALGLFGMSMKLEHNGCP